MPDKNNEETGPTESMEDQLSTVRTIVDLLDQPDGRKKAKQVLFEHWKRWKRPRSGA